MNFEISPSDSYPFFKTWEESLEFQVDGISVQAVATHSFREDRVRIVEPFEVEGSVYLQGFRPPLIALQAAMMSRRRSLELRGMTVKDDCIRLATNLYRLHATYLRIKPEIDDAKEKFLLEFRDELSEFQRQHEEALVKFYSERAFLRKRLRAGIIQIFEYNQTFNSLRNALKRSTEPYQTLESKVNFELERIERVLIHARLTTPTFEPAPIRLNSGPQNVNCT